MKSNTTIIIATLLIAAVIYGFFFTGTGEQPPLTASTAENPAQTRFQMLITKLPIAFNSSIFADPRFNALVDLTTQVSPESAGRLDPFAPLLGVGVK
ncbi:MAG: hypothetical protein G01um101449_30 [Parcubacteria group bacterium Gr01-1014_49]|nr:MAG: hypothetical protein G01um101449_30 [Parcubacteria group bacterium Gr01-1014_49]